MRRIKTQIQGIEKPSVTVQLYELQSVYVCNSFVWIHHTDITQNAQWCTLYQYWKIQLVTTRQETKCRQHQLARQRVIQSSCVRLLNEIRYMRCMTRSAKESGVFAMTVSTKRHIFFPNYWTV